MLETLEGRRLHNTSSHARPVYYVQDATLHVSGSRSADAIELSGSSGSLLLKLNGHRRSITAAVKNVVIYGGAGDDKIQCGEADVDPAFDDLTLPSYTDGGTGNDTVFTGLGVDTVFGGTGDDTIMGVLDRDPADYFDGGRGDDTLAYGGTMYGGAGTDRATLDNATENAVTGGLERLDSIADGQVLDPTLAPNQAIRLGSKDGRLLFTVPTGTDFVQKLSGPVVQADDRLAIVMTATYPQKGQTLHSGMPSLLLSDADTASAYAHGLVLTYTGKAALVFGPLNGRTLLVPPR